MYEDSAYAYVMAASVEKAESSRVAFAQKAILLVQEALELIGRVKTLSSQADGEALDLLNWVNNSSELDRCHYIKAITLAIISNSGGVAQKQDIIKELGYIAPSYLEEFPPQTNDDLRQAIKPN